MKKNYVIFFVLMFVVAISDVYALEIAKEKPISLSDIKRIVEANAEQVLEQPHINSVSIVVTYQGLQHIGHFGELTKDKNDTPNGQTVYEIGSTSKTFLGALIAGAVLDEKLALDDQASQYMGADFLGFGDNKSPITIRHLLTHTAGLPNMLPVEANNLLANFADEETPERLNKVMEAYSKTEFVTDLQALELEDPPGQTYSYSSTGTEVLALILENVYGENYDVILDRFTRELAMYETKIVLNKQQKTRLAIGYHADNSVPAPAMARVIRGAAGSMKSTTGDMLKYLEYQLDKNDPIVLESHKVLFSSSDGRRTAYKWNVSNEGFFGDFLFHHGGIPRAQNYTLIAPEKDFGLFIITNQSGTSTPRVLLDGLNGIMADIEGQQ